jgi:predicted nucleic acid-binding protein
MAVIEGEEDLVVTDVALAEAAFATTRLYRLPREDVVGALVGLIQRDNVEVFRLEKHLAVEALMLCQPSNRVSFADALIWAAARSDQDATIYTFDARFPALDIKTVQLR